jgi:hypothetical protein
MKEDTLSKEEIEALYSFLSLEWEGMDEETKKTWEYLLIELENKIDEKNNNLRP